MLTPIPNPDGEHDDEHDDLPSPDDAPAWHRRICRVGDRIVVSGDLPEGDERAIAALREWIEAGVTGIVDCRGEYSDEELVARAAPGLRYVHVGTDDNGTERDDTWFDDGVDGAIDVWLETDGLILIHCHMGINRGPSMAYAVLLTLGWHHLEALDAIRRARPISAVLYAEDAVRWWANRSALSETEALRLRRDVRAWHRDNDIDVATAIRRIRDAS